MSTYVCTACPSGLTTQSSGATSVSQCALFVTCTTIDGTGCAELCTITPCVMTFAASATTIGTHYHNSHHYHYYSYIVTSMHHHHNASL
jgi:hypothetical protein